MNPVDFQLLFQSAPGMHIVLSPDCKIVAASNAYVQAAQRPREELLGRVFYEVFPDNPQDIANNSGYSLRGALQTVLDQKKTLHTPLRKYNIPKTDGTFETKYWSSEDRPILNEQNEIDYIIHTIEDITDLVRSEQLFSNIFEYNPISIALSRISDGKVMSVNKAFLSLYGYSSKEQILDKATGNSSSPEELEARKKIIAALQKGQQLVGIEGQITVVDGTRKWISCSMELVEINGETCLLSAIEDIGQKKEREALLQLQSDQLKQANEELETFSYSVSHDLKAPLRSLEGFSKLLIENYKGKFDEDADRWLRFISENANRMGILINDILNFSRISRSNVNKIPVNMQALAQKTFDSEKNNYLDKSIELHIGTLKEIEGDYAMLGQVWQNLISNALKYSSKNEHISVSIDCKTESDFVFYSIKDNGVGFDEKYKDKLFGVFQRLHRSEEFEGTGVGLAIVHRIIQKHGGKIEVSSTIGKGTEFIFALPLIKPNES